MSRGEGKYGHQLSLETLFARGIPFEGPIDIDYLANPPNADVAQEALNWMRDQSFEFELRERHTHEDVVRAWRGVLRGCVAYGVPIPEDLRGYARRLGVVIPS